MISALARRLICPRRAIPFSTCARCPVAAPYIRPRIPAGGALLRTAASPMADMRATREQRLAVSGDGAVVEFAVARGTLRFDAGAGRLATVTSADPSLATARLGAPGLTPSNWKDSSVPRLNGVPLAMD